MTTVTTTADKKALVTLLLAELPDRAVFIDGNNIRIEPALTPEQEARLNTLIARIQAAQTDYAQVETLRADLLGYRDEAQVYLGLASPSNTQSVAAIKALIRICGIIIRLLFILIDFVTQKAVQGFR